MRWFVRRYPLIMQIESHLDVDDQKTMARMLVDVLGDSLYIDDGSFDLSGENHLPSPESYRGRILIKVCKISTDSRRKIRKVFDVAE